MKPAAGDTALLGLETAWLPMLITVLHALLWVVAVIGISLMGWAISSLNVLAGWTPADLGGRLEIVRGILASIAAGGVAAVVATSYSMPIPVMLLAVFFAGMLGDKFLKPLAERVIVRIGAAFDTLFGK